MIHEKTIGNWTLGVAQPTPIWITITRGEDSIRFAEYELQDLIYALRCAEIEMCAQYKTAADQSETEAKA